MVDLTGYIIEGLTPGVSKDLYLNKFLKIGTGKLLTLTSSSLKVEGSMKIPGLSIKGIVEILIIEKQGKETCTLLINENEFNNCTLKEINNKLEINHPDVIIRISNDKIKWIEINVVRPFPIKFGIKVQK